MPKVAGVIRRPHFPAAIGDKDEIADIGETHNGRADAWSAAHREQGFLTADDGNTDRNNQFDFALVGDAPYGPTVTVPPPPTLGGKTYQTYPSPEYDALIADINRRNKVLFTVHVGDIKGGSTWCVGGNPAKDPTDQANVYTTNLSVFNNFRKGLVYLPGDNEWTNCHRANNGAYDPLERLAYLRSVFFTSNLNLGQAPITLVRQSDDAGYELYKENVMWRAGSIAFVAINQPGSNNNSQRTTGVAAGLSEAEFIARNNANIAGINKAFDMAMADTSTRAIVIMQQANVFERFLESGQGYTRSGYEAFVTTLRARTIAFGEPVVLVGGDTHTAGVDKPLTTLYPGYLSNPLPPAPTVPALQPPSAGTRIRNFTRVEVFGSPDTHWVRAVVDPFDPNVFSFAFQTIDGNGKGHATEEELQ